MKTNESRGRGGQCADWLILNFPAPIELRDGLIDVANQIGVVRSAVYHLALRRGLASLQEKSVDARDLIGLLPPLDFRRSRRSPPKTSGGDKS